MGGVDHIRAIPWKYMTLPDDALSGATHSFDMPQRDTDAVVCPTRGLGSSTLPSSTQQQTRGECSGNGKREPLLPPAITSQLAWKLDC